jgi:Tol biopolymer transport system component
VIPAIRSKVRYLFLLRLDDHAYPGTLQARSPAFSPDGRWLAFMAGGKLMKVTLDGGTPIALTEADGMGSVACITAGTVTCNHVQGTGDALAVEWQHVPPNFRGGAS